MLLYVGSSKFGDCLQINEEKRAIIQLQVKEIQLRFIPVMSVGPWYIFLFLLSETRTWKRIFPSQIKQARLTDKVTKTTAITTTSTMTTPESFVHRPDHITESVGHQSAISIFTGGRQSVCLTYVDTNLGRRTASNRKCVNRMFTNLTRNIRNTQCIFPNIWLLVSGHLRCLCLSKKVAIWFKLKLTLWGR